ncbi:MAG: MipA/OmpV family protein, partial [Fusobacterium sp.]
MKKIALISSALLLASQVALGSSVGIGYGVTNEFFKGGDNSYVLPMLNYEYDNYFIDAKTTNSIHLGYRFLQDDIYTFSLYAIPFGGYEVEASDLDSGYKGIDDRDYQFMLGSEFKYYNGIYDIETILNAEVGKEGGTVSLRIEKPYVVNADLIVKPSVSFSYYNSSLVDYYFGIDSGEASTSTVLNSY